MDADAVDSDRNLRAVEGDDGAGLQHGQDPRGGRLGIMDHGARLLARHEIAGLGIGAVGEDLPRRSHAAALGSALDLGAGDGQDHQLPVHGLDRACDRVGGRRILRCPIGKRAMGLHVGDAMAGQGRHAHGGAQLIGDQTLDLARRISHGTAPEPLKVGIAGMGADGDTRLLGRSERLGHDLGIPGMEAAGDIDAGDDAQHGAIVAHAPIAEAFSQIAIQIDRRHWISPTSYR